MRHFIIVALSSLLLFSSPVNTYAQSEAGLDFLGGGASASSVGVGVLVGAATSVASACLPVLIGGTLSGYISGALGLFKPLVSVSNTEEDLVECALDGAAEVLKLLILNRIKNDLVEYIQSGFYGKPLFIENPKQFLTELQSYTLDALVAGGGPLGALVQGLCEGIRADVSIELKRFFGEGYRPTCTIDRIEQRWNTFVEGDLESLKDFEDLVIVGTADSDYTTWRTIEEAKRKFLEQQKEFGEPRPIQKDGTVNKPDEDCVKDQVNRLNENQREVIKLQAELVNNNEDIKRLQGLNDPATNGPRINALESNNRIIEQKISRLSDEAVFSKSADQTDPSDNVNLYGVINEKCGVEETAEDVDKLQEKVGEDRKETVAQKEGFEEIFQELIRAIPLGIYNRLTKKGAPARTRGGSVKPDVLEELAPPIKGVGDAETSIELKASIILEPISSLEQLENDKHRMYLSIFSLFENSELYKDFAESCRYSPLSIQREFITTLVDDGVIDVRGRIDVTDLNEGEIISRIESERNRIINAPRLIIAEEVGLTNSKKEGYAAAKQRIFNLRDSALIKLRQVSTSSMEEAKKQEEIKKIADEFNKSIDAIASSDVLEARNRTEIRNNETLYNATINLFTDLEREIERSASRGNSSCRSSASELLDENEASGLPARIEKLKSDLGIVNDLVDYSGSFSNRINR